MIFLRLFFASKIGVVITTILACAGFFYSWLAIHDRNLINETTKKYNAQQEKIYNEKVAEFEQKIQKLEEEKQTLIAQQKQDVVDTIKGVSDIKKAAAATGEPVPATPYLKTVVKSLNDGLNK